MALVSQYTTRHSAHSLSSPPPGRRDAPPDDRLQRGSSIPERPKLNRDAAAYWIVRSSRTTTAQFDASNFASMRRPGERRDPYAVSSHFGAGADAFCNNESRGLWVPAFAGTTRGESLREGEVNCLW